MTAAKTAILPAKKRAREDWVEVEMTALDGRGKVIGPVLVGMSAGMRDWLQARNSECGKARRFPSL